MSTSRALTSIPSGKRKYLVLRKRATQRGGWTRSVPSIRVKYMNLVEKRDE